MILPLLDIVFHKAIRDPNSPAGERGESLPRLRYVTNRPITCVQQGQWLILTGLCRTVRTPISNIADAVEFEPNEIPAELAKLIAAQDAPPQKSAKGG